MRSGVCRRFGLRLILFVAIAALYGTPVAAQIRLDPAYPNHRPTGPGLAKGAVVWSHGRSVHAEDSAAPNPPYLAVLRDSGWDVFRLNRMRDSDTLAASSRALEEQVAQLRQRGYRRVVLAGQSFGAFLSLITAGRTDQVHAVIATAPAAYGSFSEFYDSWRNNATRLYPLLEDVKTARVMLFYFHGDEFDPGGRGDRSRAILESKRLDHLIVDQPAQITGHWAAGTGLFARRFGSCIERFIDAPAIAGELACEESWGRRPSRQISLPNDYHPTSSSGPTGKTNPFLGQWYGFYENGREFMLAIEKVNGNDVTAIYALGAGISETQAPEWVRRKGRIAGDELVFKEKGRNTLVYKLRPDGRLNASWISADGDNRLDTVIQRID